MSGLLLTGCSNQAKASAPKTVGQPQLTRLTKQIRNLYADSKYEMPAKQLSEESLTKANKVIPCTSLTLKTALTGSVKVLLMRHILT